MLPQKPNLTERLELLWSVREIISQAPTIFSIELELRVDIPLKRFIVAKVSCEISRPEHLNQSEIGATSTFRRATTTS